MQTYPERRRYPWEEYTLPMAKALKLAARSAASNANGEPHHSWKAVHEALLYLEHAGGVEKVPGHKLKAMLIAAARRHGWLAKTSAGKGVTSVTGADGLRSCLGCGQRHPEKTYRIPPTPKQAILWGYRTPEAYTPIMRVVDGKQVNVRPVPPIRRGQWRVGNYCAECRTRKKNKEIQARRYKKRGPANKALRAKLNRVVRSLSCTLRKHGPGDPKHAFAKDAIDACLWALAKLDAMRGRKGNPAPSGLLGMFPKETRARLLTLANACIWTRRINPLVLELRAAQRNAQKEQ